jgi:hypothetical protein
MKKEFTQSIKSLILALAIGLFASVASATWSENLTSPPGDNSWAPFRSDLGSQFKSGAMQFGGTGDCFPTMTGMLEVCGETRFVDGFVNAPSAATGTDVPMYSTDDIRLGPTDTDTDEFDYGGAALLPSLLVGGKLQTASNFDPTEAVDVGGTIRIKELSAFENPGKIYPAKVCSDTNGDFFICPQLTASISAPTVTNQEYTPQGGGTANCTADVSFTSSVLDGELPYIYLWKIKNNSGSTTIKVAGETVDPGEWKTVSTTATASFGVFIKNPGDSWTAQFTVTDAQGATQLVTENFGIFSIGGCN